MQAGRRHSQIMHQLVINHLMRSMVNMKISIPMNIVLNKPKADIYQVLMMNSGQAFLLSQEIIHLIVKRKMKTEIVIFLILVMETVPIFLKIMKRAINKKFLSGRNLDVGGLLEEFLMWPLVR